VYHWKTLTCLASIIGLAITDLAMGVCELIPLAKLGKGGHLLDPSLDPNTAIHGITQRYWISSQVVGKPTKTDTK
jgi:hypothetical protein